MHIKHGNFRQYLTGALEKEHMYIRVFDKRTDTEKENNHGHEKNKSFVYQVVLMKYHNTWQNISQIER